MGRVCPAASVDAPSLATLAEGEARRSDPALRLAVRRRAWLG